MLLHGSDKTFKTLKSNRSISSQKKWKGKDDIIYFSPSLAYALFFAVRPSSGMSRMDIRKGIVYFQRLDELASEKDVYIHIIDISDIPLEKRKWVNNYELEAQLDEIKPVRIETHKTAEIFEHFQVIKDEEEFKRLKAS